MSSPRTRPNSAGLGAGVGDLGVGVAAVVDVSPAAVVVAADVEQVAAEECAVLRRARSTGLHGDSRGAKGEGEDGGDGGELHFDVGTSL
jgi:hypothetical protein